jgi:pimeloyl-ACP methyl ester carboxylesterase
MWNSKMLVAYFQGIFFPNIRVPPRSEWKQKLRELGTFSELTIKANGRNLAAYTLFPISGKVRGITILAHPISKKAKYYFEEVSRISYYLQNEYAILAFDYNGFGESEPLDFYYWKDAVAVIEHARSIYSELDLLIHGLSFGSFHLIRALATLPLRSAVVLENTPRSLMDYWGKWWHTRLAINITNQLPIQSFKDMNVQSALNELRRPDLRFLFIAGAKDKITPAHQMRDLAKLLCPSQVNFLELATCDHYEAPTVEPTLYADAIAKLVAPKRY